MSQTCNIRIRPFLFLCPIKLFLRVWYTMIDMNECFIIHLAFSMAKQVTILLKIVKLKLTVAKQETFHHVSVTLSFCNLPVCESGHFSRSTSVEIIWLLVNCRSRWNGVYNVPAACCFSQLTVALKLWT